MADSLKDLLARGAEQAEQMQAESRPSGGKFKPVDWFGLKDKETIILRFLDDEPDWLSVMQHAFTLTRPAPPDYPEDRTWPKQMGAVCRATKQLAHLFPDGCYICDEMHIKRPNPKTKNNRWYPAVRLWARAVVREEVRATTAAEAERFGVAIGAVAGYRDAEYEVEETDAEGKPTGNKVMKKRVLVINQALKNFYGQLKAYANVYGTVLDRDYQITRKGEGQQTDFDIVSMNPITRSDGSTLDLRTTMEVDSAGKETGRTRREAILEDAPDLYDLIDRQLSDFMYDKFFDDRHKYPEFKGGDDGDKGSSDSGGPKNNGGPQSNGGGAKEAPSEADQQVVKNRLAAMRDRVRGEHGNGNGSAEPAEEEKQPAAAAAGSGRTTDFD